jgi:hypothetical protein
MADFGWDVSRRLQLLRALDDKESSTVRKQHSATFRRYRAAIESAVVSDLIDASMELKAAVRILHNRSELIRAIAPCWKTACGGERATTEVVCALMHMSINRLGVAADERMIYGLLRKVTESRVARGSQAATS